ncbi:MAG: alcohol dehydrogenase catalytic domain-containing protein [Bacteroidales bacterium]
MRAMKLTGIGRMEMQEVPAPRIRDDEDVLIRMKTMGVCGSDIHYYRHGRIGSQVVEYPFAVGHEGAGVVEAVGPAVTRVKPGDRVAIEPAMPCWECDQCKAGRPHTCRNLRFLGCPGQAEGLHCETIVMPQQSCFPLPDNLGFDEGVISEPLAIGLYAVRQSIPMEGARVGILGFGPIGMSVLLPALALGARHVVVTDKIDARLEIARQNGAGQILHADRDDVPERVREAEPGLLDVVFECCGQQEAMDEAVRILKPGGKLMVIGIPAFDRWSFSVDDLRRKEICVQNVRRQNHAVEGALDLMARGLVDVRGMVTHRFPFGESDRAFDLVAGYRDGVMKAMIDFD